MIWNSHPKRKWNQYCVFLCSIVYACYFCFWILSLIWFVEKLKFSFKYWFIYYFNNYSWSAFNYLWRKSKTGLLLTMKLQYLFSIMRISWSSKQMYICMCWVHTIFASVQRFTIVNLPDNWTLIRHDTYLTKVAMNGLLWKLAGLQIS